jgi:signal peptidase I
MKMLASLHQVKMMIFLSNFLRTIFMQQQNRGGLLLKIFLLDLFDLVSFLIFVTGVVLFIRFFVFNPYSVVGASMEPNFHQGDFIIVDKVTPKMGSFKRGDIIVFVPK